MYMIQTNGKCQAFLVFLLYLLHQYRIHQESDPIYIYSSCNAPSPIAIPDIKIQKLASVSTVIFESPPESNQNQLSSAKMSPASDKYSLFKLPGLPTQGFRTNHNKHDYMHTFHTWLFAINSAIVNQLSAEHSFRTNYSIISEVYISFWHNFFHNKPRKQGDWSVHVVWNVNYGTLQRIAYKIIRTSECNRGPQTRLEVNFKLMVSCIIIQF